MRSIVVKVKPGSSRSELQELEDGSWVAWVRSPPVDGRANDELIRLVARRFGVPPSAVEIRSGGAGRLKRVRIDEA